MELKEFTNRAKVVRDKYARIETALGGKPWQARERMEGLVGDVGDLMKLVMAKQGLRAVEDVDKKLEHELSDCLWSILIIADELKIDLEKAFLDGMNELENKINEKSK